MGVRNIAPSLMIILGKDQDAYDFMKWHGTAGQDSHYDWGDMSLPFLDLHGEGAFEALAEGDWTDEYADLAHQAALTLIKFRLLLDLYSLQSSMREVTEQLPQELVDNIRKHLISDIVAGHAGLMQDVRDGVFIKAYIENIESQMNAMFDVIHKANKHFWPAMVNPGSHLTARPEYTGQGSVMEMQVELQNAYPAWKQTPGAIDWIEAKLGS
ncbi:unnamed protein product [Zymoseptoria tritici ST99CH_1A5]|nr:unnamed protein product [Zymoseptoria tritici ST99CH_3D7]SMR55489.1 unnamed protein product [Zymoseptoria tritici ST99CH_1E4]SMR57863.1 unnamed protein product [Zymoseptoria tritici ST99CH_3D1]SMY26299.1 unnamed protein product [Zymoseptoria tritici ST99CH_1A5]